MENGSNPFEGGRYHYVKLGVEEPPRSVPPPGADGGVERRARRSRTMDRVIGVLLGLVLGVGIVTAYVFLGSEETIDAPRVHQGEAAGEAPQQPGERGVERE